MWLTGIKEFMRFALLFMFLMNMQQSTSQNVNDEQIKRVQRSIFIFNFAEQVKWTNLESNTSFNIGVLGADRTTIDLKALSLKRKIHGKPVNVYRFNRVKDIKDIQLLYVNESFNFDLEYILSKVEGQEVLLVTEDYNFHSSMINIVNVGKSFEYEIQTSKITNQGLKYATSLVDNAVTSSQKWKDLYQKTEKDLNVVKENNEVQKQIISAKSKEVASQQKEIYLQRQIIDTIESRVTEQNIWIEDLGDLSDWQQRKYEDKERIEIELEKRIKSQLQAIEEQGRTIVASNLKIERQLEFLEEQGRKIKLKDEVLKNKEDTLSVYRKMNMLLLIIAAFILLGGGFIYRNYLSKKKLNTVLATQNIAIEKQSKAIEVKNQELEQFVYIASHDLKEPLVTISGLIELLKEDYANALDGEGNKVLGYIGDSSIRMRNLIDGLLEYSKLGESKAFTSIDCNVLLDTLKVDLSNVIERTKATVIGKELPNVEGLELELRLLFQNLITNGIKFRKTVVNPIIEINCKKIANVVNPSRGVYQFSVKDNGIGIHEKHHKRIFSIFQRLHSREAYDGTGIGLAHCKKIVEAHSGSIWLESELGKGSTFYFTIPF